THRGVPIVHSIHLRYPTISTARARPLPLSILLCSRSPPFHPTPSPLPSTPFRYDASRDTYQRPPIVHPLTPA
ncbi:hypothetical protein Pmar_PMAR001113, partial [Perkinsus marinus ATCC 50983]